MPTCKIIFVPIFTFKCFSELLTPHTLLSHMHQPHFSSSPCTNLNSTHSPMPSSSCLAKPRQPTSTQPTVQRQAPVAQPSQGQPRSRCPIAHIPPPNQAKASLDRAAQPSQGQPRLCCPTTFLFFLYSSSTLLLPLG